MSGRMERMERFRADIDDGTTMEDVWRWHAEDQPDCPERRLLWRARTYVFTCPTCGWRLRSIIGIEWVPQSRRMRNVRDPHAPDLLWILTPEELDRLPEGTVVTNGRGVRKVTGKDVIDRDTRGGYTVWGLFESELPPYEPTIRGDWEEEVESGG